MEIRLCMLALAPISAFFAVAFLIQVFFFRLKMLSIREEARGGSVGHFSFTEFLLRHGVVSFGPVARLLLKNKRISCFVADIVSFLQAKAYTTTHISVASLLGALVIVIFCVSSFITLSLFIGLLTAGTSLALVGIVLKQSQEAKREVLRESIPETLRSMSMCFHAGYSLQQTFKQIAQEAPEPLASLFNRAVNDLETGKTVPETLNMLKESTDADELAFVSVALDIQHRAGGSLRQVLDAARDAVESELELKRTLKVQTAQAKLSARIVSAMPFVLVTVFSCLSPGFLDPFFRSFEGVVLLCLAIVLQVSGILMVRRLLNVDVSQKG